MFRRSAGQPPVWGAGAGSPRRLSEAGHGDSHLVWKLFKLNIDTRWDNSQVPVVLLPARPGLSV